MHRLAVILLVLIAFEISVSTVKAKVKSFRELSATQIMALQTSEARLAIFDRDLRDLERDRDRRKISARDFAWEQRDMMAFIAAESEFQNSILIRESTFPEGPHLSDKADAVLRTIGKYSIEAPVYIAVAALEGLGRSGYTFSP
jgi:hypothetical protein